MNKFIIGLGNPGLEYRSTKHNIGFNVVKKLAKDNDIKLIRKTRFSIAGRGIIDGRDVMLVLPQTFMNQSGRAVGELVSHEVYPHTKDFGMGVKDLTDLLVICDDINLELGKIRMRKQGSAGGHKGLESIIHTLGTEAFPRLRVGIATDIHRGDISNYVLTPFKRKELRNAKHAIALASKAAEGFIKEGADLAMTKFNKMRAGTS